MLAVDFFTVETISLQRVYVLFFIELGNRSVHLAGCTANPTGTWVTQQARQFAWTLQERPGSFRFLIRDRDSKFTRDFDAVFASESIEIIKTPIQAPKANAFAERFVRTARAESLDWLLIMNRRHLERVLRVFIDHYNTHRPHRSLNLTPPTPTALNVLGIPPTPASIERRDRLGGLLHEYKRRVNRLCAPDRGGVPPTNVLTTALRRRILEVPCAPSHAVGGSGLSWSSG
jgi:putative transposase